MVTSKSLVKLLLLYSISETPEWGRAGATGGEFEGWQAPGAGAAGPGWAGRGIRADGSGGRWGRVGLGQPPAKPHPRSESWGHPGRPLGPAAGVVAGEGLGDSWRVPGGRHGGLGGREAGPGR
jgi:hypothetical protein